ncbi:uncharacterized protein ALTATR162_LOCUS6962 [Alternaria atra]|uniref:Uncharacterized protein n=1 Tax=Alternaria atra TaxID=119953 RepID=A0A8J2IC90_9PLEO|nr:uncharacterized protein ALTATR162_LOCUS6962 [Alternaria atra]CAG5166680.1 unnamed protein product [Alternaria atra]
MSKPSSLFTSYTDAASTYWPPGWNFQRYAHATPADNAALSDEERAKMQAGFREALGEDGVMEMARVVWQEQLRRMKLEKESSSAATASSSSSAQKQQQQRPPPPPPDWLKTWRKRVSGDGGGAWGFVAFCTSSAVAAMPESDVVKFHTRVWEVAEIPIQKALEEEGQPADEIAEARRSFEIRWVEVDDDDEDAKGEEGKGEAGTGGDWVEKARASYRAMRESGVLPSGLDLPVFLCASPAAVASVLRTSLAEAKEAHEGKPRWRSGDVPFLLVAAAETEQGIVEEDDDDEEEEEETKVGGGERSWFKPVFKAAAEVLVDELWWAVAEQITSLGQMTRFVRGETVAKEHATTTEEERQGEGGEAANVSSRRAEEPGHNDDGLDDIWWTVHMPPRQIRKRRRV